MSSDMQERIDAYWSKRADEFSACRLQDLKGRQRGLWIDLIREMVPDGRGLRALDVGTGAGFHAFVLAELGFEVTGIDYSRAMVESALRNAARLGYGDISFCRMDAQKLDFPDAAFDVIISRNVTWTLPDPEKAYGEWCRVLAPGGCMLNFDANYGQAFKRADESGETYAETRRASPSPYPYPAQSREMIRERNDIAKQLYVCEIERPQWDVDVLIQNGMRKITVCMDIGERVFPEMEKETDAVASARHCSLFMVFGEKA